MSEPLTCPRCGEPGIMRPDGSVICKVSRHGWGYTVDDWNRRAPNPLLTPENQDYLALIKLEAVEAERDKWMARFEEAEYRGLAYMQERDKLRNEVVLLRAEIVSAGSQLLNVQQDCVKAEARCRELEIQLRDFQASYGRVCGQLQTLRQQVENKELDKPQEGGKEEGK
jgi:chromosome segregation ATPase